MKLNIRIQSLLKTSLALCLTAQLASCSDTLGEINTNPNYPTNVTAELLINPILRSLASQQFNYGSNGAGLAHHISRVNYNETEQYLFSTNEGTWTNLYTNLNNIKEVEKVAVKDNNKSTQALAYILKAFAAAQLTDSWRDVPYTEATLGAECVTPKYDTQESIYTAEGGIIDLLIKAEQMLSSDASLIPNDLIFSGDRMKWRKFGNSLRLRYLMRISNRANDVTTFNIKSEIAKVMTLPLMENNSDNASLDFLVSSPDRCPIYDMRAGDFEYLRMSEEIYSLLSGYNDPRMTVWFAPTQSSIENGGGYAYGGVALGCSKTTLEQIGYEATEVSMIGDYFRSTADNAESVIMNASEVKFLQAEAIARGFASGDAQTLYEDGIELSIAYWGASMPATYLTQAGVSYNASTALEQIMEQKWLSLFFVGNEAWLDFLRTGLPAQKLPIDNRNPEAGEIPSRFYYPETEQAVNGASYSAAVKLMGGSDDINAKMWWE